MKIVFYASETERYAGIRHRVIHWMTRLAEEGDACRFCPPAPVAWWEALYRRGGRPGKLLYLVSVAIRRLFQIRHAPGAAVFFVKGPLFPYGPPMVERLLCALNRHMIFDVDDAMWEPPAYVVSPFLRWVDYGWAEKMAKMARCAVAGNPLIAAYLQEKGCRNIVVIPTCVDMNQYSEKRYAAPGEKSVVTLGWMGTRDNLGYLRRLEKPLQAVAAAFSLRLLVVSDGRFDCPGVSVENRPWRLEREAADLAEMDIGLMPLDDTPRARGKCAFKAIQYMAVGTPPIVSPVGMNCEVVEEGLSGYWAATPEEWQKKLALLIADAPLRERMGRAARARIEKHYSYDAHYPAFKALLAAAAEEGKE